MTTVLVLEYGHSIMKDLVIKELQQQLEISLEKIVQETLDEYSSTIGNDFSMETRAMLGFEVSKDLFVYSDIAKKEYTKIGYEYGLTTEEIEKIVNESVSKIFNKYFER